MSEPWDDCEGHWDDDPCDGVETECPFCDGIGLVTLDVTPGGSLMTECAECGGTGWY